MEIDFKTASFKGPDDYSIDQRDQYFNEFLHASIYANPIMYPAVSKKNSRIRMNTVATPADAQINRILKTFEDVSTVFSISRANQV